MLSEGIGGLPPFHWKSGDCLQGRREIGLEREPGQNGALNGCALGQAM